MKFFLDSANLDELESFMKTGIFVGVTTNPSILKERGLLADDLPPFAKKLAKIGAQEIFFQVSGEDAKIYVQQALFLAERGKGIVVKLPCTREGLEAASVLAKEKIKTCITAVYAAHQALLAASVGAGYVAPYLGRMNDAGRDGHALIAQMAQALRQGGAQTEILAASIRSVEDVTLLAQNGAGCVTLSPKIAAALFEEPLTLEAIRRFNADAGNGS